MYWISGVTRRKLIGHRDEARFGERDVDLHPFDAVVGEQRDAIALLKAQTEKRVGELARARVPFLERQRAARIARAELCRAGAAHARRRSRQG